MTRILLCTLVVLAGVAFAIWTRPSTYVPMTDTWRLLDKPRRPRV